MQPPAWARSPSPRVPASGRRLRYQAMFQFLRAGLHETVPGIDILGPFGGQVAQIMRRVVLIAAGFEGHRLTAEKTITTLCDLGMIAMNPEVIWDISDIIR